jgi:protocatechuate 3,4-dioxygenase alpha subunit
MAHRRVPTPSQTIGPFFPEHFFGEADHDLTFVDDSAKHARGQRIYIGGNIYEAERVPRWNCVVEIWQPDANGHFNHPNDPRRSEADPNFIGWGRRSSDDAGWYDFITVKPGGYADPLTGLQRAPHINIAIMSSGLMRRLVTTLFFPDEPANAQDPVFNAIPDAAIRERLVLKPARLERAPQDALTYRLDIVLQGEGETPFFVD